MDDMLHGAVLVEEGQFDVYATADIDNRTWVFHSLYFQKPLPSFEGVEGGPVIVVNLTDVLPTFAQNPMFETLRNAMMEILDAAYERRKDAQSSLAP